MPDLEFRGQKEGEEVMLVLKQHPVVFIFPLKKLWFWGLWILEIIFVFLSYFFTWQLLNIVISYYFYLALVVTIYLFITAWYCWANTIYLLTNERIIVVEQKGWFSRVISESTLVNILFISHKVEGPLQTLLNFGSIHIRSAGAVEEEIVLANISDPYEVQQEIVSDQKKITGREATVREEGENKDFWKDRDKREKPLIR